MPSSIVPEMLLRLRSIDLSWGSTHNITHAVDKYTAGAGHTPLTASL